MNEEFPHFRYHPNPILTGMVVESSKVCVCCSQYRGFIYIGPVYARGDHEESLCPWCIADGSAAQKLDASFADDRPLQQAKVSDAVVKTVSRQTPGYISWQTDEWLSHCDDAAAYCGDASAQDVASMLPSEKFRFLAKYKLDEDEWEEIRPSYSAGGDPGIYKFQCIHCGEVLFGMDCR